MWANLLDKAVIARQISLEEVLASNREREPGRFAAVSEEESHER